MATYHDFCDTCFMKHLDCRCSHSKSVFAVSDKVILKMRLQGCVAELRTHNIIKVPEVTRLLKMITRRTK